MHSPGFDGSSSLGLQMLMNADSLYSAAHCALLLNLKLSHGDYYRKRPALAPSTMVSVRLPRPGPPRANGSPWAGTHRRGPERAGSAVPVGLAQLCPRAVERGHSASTGTFVQAAHSNGPQNCLLGSRSEERVPGTGCLPGAHNPIGWH